MVHFKSQFVAAVVTRKCVFTYMHALMHALTHVCTPVHEPGFFACLYTCPLLLCSAWEDWKSELDPLELELQMIASCHVGAIYFHNIF